MVTTLNILFKFAFCLTCEELKILCVSIRKKLKSGIINDCIGMKRIINSYIN